MVAASVFLDPLEQGIETMKKHLMIGLAAGAAALSGTAAAAPVLNAANGHYYQYIDQRTSIWEDALAAAAGMSYNGMQGYLATITSAQENAFIASNVTQSVAWVAGSDKDAEGVWKWMAGPEAGQVFTYTNWAPGEPNNCCGGENYLHFNWAFSGGWNDIRNNYDRYGYVVEFSMAGVPEPASWAMIIAGMLGVAGALRARPRLRARTA